MQPRAKILSLLAILVLGPPWRAFADSVAEYGCHHDEITDSYFCSSGPLEGREFLTQSEVEEAILAEQKKTKDAQTAEHAEELLPPTAGRPAPPTPKKPVVAEDHFIVMSWNMKALAGPGSDYDRAAMVLAQADVASLQEMDLHGQGKGFINVIANLIQSKSQEKICRAWVQAANGDRQGYGFLWKESTIGYVDNEGVINETCGDTAATIRQSKKMKMASEATFYFKAQKKIFVVGDVFVSERPKNSDKSVNELFKSFDDSKWPVLITGDLKIGPSNSAFNLARKMEFHSALGNGKRKNWDNIWYRGVTLTQASPVDVFEKFSDARHEDIHQGFSGIYPVAAEFSLKLPSTDDLSVVGKAKAKSKAKSKKKSVKATTAQGD
jgi:hypothetical protein